MRTAVLFTLILLSETNLWAASTPKSNWLPEDLLIHAIDPVDETKVLTDVQITEDISYLIYALDRGYGGRHFLPKHEFQNLQQDLEKLSAPMNRKQFCMTIRENLSRTSDNHLTARLNGHSCKRKSIEAKPLVGHNLNTDKQKAWKVFLKKVNHKNVLHIAITYFPLAENPKWNGFLTAVKKSLQKSDAIILDLRGNPGGENAYGHKLARLLSGGTLKMVMHKKYKRQTPETLAIWLNVFRKGQLKTRAKGKNLPGWLKGRLLKAQQKYQQAVRGQLPEIFEFFEPSDEKAFDAAKGYKKPIYILMDRKTGSASENTIDAFEFHPYVKKVGQNTVGVVHFGNVGKVYLPNSKVEIFIPTHYNEYLDKRFIEKKGIAPDINVPEGRDAYQFVLENELS